MTNIIKLEDFSFSLKKQNWKPLPNDCLHKNTTLDENGQTVRCDDCGGNLSPYWVLKEILESIKKERERLKNERENLRKYEETTLVMRAAKEVEKAWRSKTMVPSCPHCNRGILAKDGFGESMTCKEFEMSRRKS